VISDDFFQQWDTWFVGNFQLEHVRQSLDDIKTILSARSYHMLKEKPTISFIGPGASIFKETGFEQWPIQNVSCHIIILLENCPLDWIAKVNQAESQLRIPVIRLGEGSLERNACEWMECYFISAAWERRRSQISGLGAL